MAKSIIQTNLREFSPRVPCFLLSSIIDIWNDQPKKSPFLWLFCLFISFYIFIAINVSSIGWNSNEGLMTQYSFEHDVYTLSN